MVQLHVGQGLDIAVHKIEKKEDLPSTSKYIRFASLKTGELLKMLVRMMGAVLKIDREAINTLNECMSNMGIAFQIVDDVLNVSNS
jgi:geranylgeranyl pyrophosphate synthase